MRLYREFYRVCVYCILYILVESYKKFFEYIINDFVLEGIVCKEKDSLIFEWIFMYIIWIESIFNWDFLFSNLRCIFMFFFLIFYV